MPELPEAEIARRNLARWMGGGEQFNAKVHDARSVRGEAEAYRARLQGRRVITTERLGKHILAHLDEGVLAVHLGMTGRLVCRQLDEETPKATRIEWCMKNIRVCFVDPRVFGRTTYGTYEQVRSSARLNRLGVDALALESGLALSRACAGTVRQIKDVLMDQARVAGLGNIQAAEALYRARLDPKQRASTLDAPQWQSLYEGIRATLEHTLAASESEEIEYMSDGAHVTNPFLVYGREDEACSRCSAMIQRIVQSSRATFFCPSCQAPS